ncbi:hypothetical protein D3C71_996330 [compost metagenome]
MLTELVPTRSAFGNNPDKSIMSPPWATERISKSVTVSRAGVTVVPWSPDSHLKTSRPRPPVSVSSPLPPMIMSFPSPALIVSFPVPPRIMSAKLLPVIVSLPSKPKI